MQYSGFFLSNQTEDENINIMKGVLAMKVYFLLESYCSGTTKSIKNFILLYDLLNLFK